MVICKPIASRIEKGHHLGLVCHIFHLHTKHCLNAYVNSPCPEHLSFLLIADEILPRYLFPHCWSQVFPLCSFTILYSCLSKYKKMIKGEQNQISLKKKKKKKRHVQIFKLSSPHEVFTWVLIGKIDKI